MNSVLIFDGYPVHLVTFSAAATTTTAVAPVSVEVSLVDAYGIYQIHYCYMQHGNKFK